MTSLTKFATVEEALEKPLTGMWTLVRFRRATNSRGFVLLHLHQTFVKVVCAKLFFQGCKMLSQPLVDTSGEYFSLHFAASNEVAGILALMFPCPSPSDRLVINQNGKLLSGMAVHVVVDPYRQAVAGNLIEA
ncbi:MAG: hypothetical protein WA902_18835 [Thermosynechococcaceae cyanobacterium]